MFRRTLVVSATALLIAACSGAATPAPTPTPSSQAQSQAPGPTPAPTVAKQWLIGVSLPTLQFPFAVALKNAIEARAQVDGVKTVVTDANLDVATELNNVEGLLQQKVDCLLFVGTQADASVGAIQAANKAGTPVVEFNGLANGGDYVAFVGSDDTQAGDLHGQWLVALQKKMAAAGKANLKVLLLNNQPGWIHDIGRDSGLMLQMNNAGIYSNITIIQQFGKGNRADSQSVTESVLTANPDLDAIVANSDDMALGALEAVKAAGKNIPMIGLDGQPEMLNDIKAGTVDATVFQDPEAQGAGGLQACVDDLNGKTLTKTLNIPYVLVTKDNVDAILAIAKRVYPPS